MKRFWWMSAVVMFVVAVLAVKQCGEWLDDNAMAAVEPDPSTMKPCQGRKPVKEHGRRFYWYCGVGRDEDLGAHLGVAKVDAIATQRRPTVGAACGRTGLAGSR
jgi:hypothetical protein